MEDELHTLEIKKSFFLNFHFTPNIATTNLVALVIQWQKM